MSHPLKLLLHFTISELVLASSFISKRSNNVVDKLTDMRRRVNATLCHPIDIKRDSERLGSIGSLCHCRCIQWCSSYCGNSQHLRRRKPILRCDWNDAMALWLTFFTVVATVNGFERFSRSSFSDYVIAESNSIETNTALPSIEKSSLMLSCHVCHSFVEGSKCIHLASNSSTFSTPCHDNQTSCMVNKAVFVAVVFFSPLILTFRCWECQTIISNFQEKEKICIVYSRWIISTWRNVVRFMKESLKMKCFQNLAIFFKVHNILAYIFVIYL